MFKDSMKITIKLVSVVIVVTILFRFFETNDLVPYFIIAVSGYVLYFIVFKGNKEILLEILCDADRFDDFVDKKQTKKPNKYNLLKAYSKFYQGKVEESIDYLKKVEYSELKSVKEKSILYMLRLKYEFENSNYDEYVKLLGEFEESLVLKKAELDISIFEIPKLIMEEDYHVAIGILKDIIPLQKKRYFILEMEYYLALCYQKLGEKDNLKAVLEFMDSKPYKIVYIDKCRDLLSKVN